MPEIKDITGKRFGRLIVIQKAVNKKHNSKNTATRWICKCDCGNTKIINSYSLRNGNTKSCGCLRRERIKHGNSGTKLYAIWANMKCRNKKTSKIICNTWLNDFNNFKNWSLNNGYTDGMFFHRKNGNGNYSPSNCYWATKAPQRQKKKKIRCIETGKIFKTQRDAGREYGVNPTCISNVLRGQQNRAGGYHWEFETAIQT